MREDRRDRKRSAAEGEAVAKPYAQPVENAAVNRQPILPLDRGKAPAFLETHGPVERIGAIHRLEVHERLPAAIRLAGHGAHGANLGDLSKRCQIGPLRIACLPVEERGLGIASEQLLALPHDGILNGVREAVDRANRPCAQRDADQENGEAAKPAPEIAECQAQFQRQAAAYRRTAPLVIHPIIHAAGTYICN